MISDKIATVQFCYTRIQITNSCFAGNQEGFCNILIIDRDVNAVVMLVGWTEEKI